MRFSGGINRPPYETADGYLQSTEKNLKRKIGYAGIVICRQSAVGAQRIYRKHFKQKQKAVPSGDGFCIYKKGNFQSYP